MFDCCQSFYNKHCKVTIFILQWQQTWCTFMQTFHSNSGTQKPRLRMQGKASPHVANRHKAHRASAGVHTCIGRSTHALRPKHTRVSAEARMRFARSTPSKPAHQRDITHTLQHRLPHIGNTNTAESCGQQSSCHRATCHTSLFNP